MRLDKFLKVSRLIKRRTLANEACDGGIIDVNGKTAKASYNVKPGDVISFTHGAHKTVAEVLSAEEKPGKEQAAQMYRLIEEK